MSNQNNISICMTFKNRADMLDKHFHFTLQQDYDPKLLTYVIADGGSTDGLIPLLRDRAKFFKKIIYFVSDRKKLPRPLKYGGPAIDYNMSVLKAPDDCVIRCDAEVVFLNDGLIKYASDFYNSHKNYVLHFNTMKANEMFDPFDISHVETYESFAINPKPFQTDANFCVSFPKKFFVDVMHGFDERFSFDYWCGEDTYAYHWVRLNHNFYTAPFKYTPVHLWHKERYSKEGRRKIVNAETVPFIRRLQMRNETPNMGGDQWKRFDIIRDYQEFIG